jgi:competence protein ComEC
VTGLRFRHHLADGAVVAGALALTLGVWIGAPAGVCIAAVAWMARWGRAAMVLCLVLSVAGGMLGDRAWSQTQPQHLGEHTGWVTLVADPAPFGQGTRITVRIEGERFDAWLYGSARRKLEGHQAGELIWLSARRTPLAGSAGRRAAVRHVVGKLDVEIIGDIVEGNGISRASNRVRSVLRRVAEQAMPEGDAALFTGLVIGDDARQPEAMITEFRTAGLSHLTAVSGQNVAFLLAATSPLLRRLRPWWRWTATCGLIAWFMALTRFEPSVLRAGVMATLAATGFALGHQVRPVRLVALAVTALVLVDPLLVWSVGFWLSVGATLGVCIVGPWLRPHLPGPGWLTLPLAVTLGAQAGVALPSLMVFGRLPVISVVANLFAVPVAGSVMLYGIPAALAAAMLPAPAANLVMIPASVGTRWVATVARVAAALEPHGGLAAMAWMVLGAALVAPAVWRWRRGGSRMPI